MPETPLPSRGPTWPWTEQLRPNTAHCRCGQGPPSSCRDLFPTPFCAAAVTGLTGCCPGWDSLCFFEGRNSSSASWGPGAEWFWLWQVSRRSGHRLQHFPGRDQYPASHAPTPNGEERGQARAGGGKRHPLPLPGLLPSPRLKLERNGSIFDSFRGEGKLQNEDDLKE